MAVHGSVLIGAALNLGRVTLKITFLFKFLLYHLKFSSDFFRDKSSDLSPPCCVLPTSSLLIIFTTIFLFFPPRHHHQTFHNLLYGQFFSSVFWKVLVVKILTFRDKFQISSVIRNHYKKENKIKTSEIFDVYYSFPIFLNERKIFVISSNDPQLFLIKS